MIEARGAARAESVHLAICWMLAAAWAIAFAVSAAGVAPNVAAALGLLQMVLLLLFVVAHGSLGYGWSGFAAYFAIAVLVSFGLEATSIATGFPFGFYTHNVHVGFKPLGVPWPVPLDYAVAGWFGWIIASLMARDDPSDGSGAARFTTPLIATFVLAGLDLPGDAIGATVLGQWTYRHPSGLFGVPLSNFLGWLFTGWVFYQLFALCQRRFPPHAATRRRGYWLAPCLIWLGFAGRYLLAYRAGASAVVTVGGRTFFAADVYETSVILCLFTHVFVGLLGTVRALGAARLETGR